MGGVTGNQADHSYFSSCLGNCDDPIFLVDERIDFTWNHFANCN